MKIYAAFLLKKTNIANKVNGFHSERVESQNKTLRVKNHLPRIRLKTVCSMDDLEPPLKDANSPDGPWLEE